ncbi:MAG: hypothetical protein WC444_03290 [Candidatus Paceibacterota bacterium]
MKTAVRSTKTTPKTVRRAPVKKLVPSRSASRAKAGPFSKMARSTKRYGKQTLRDLLLSKTFGKSFKVLLGLMITGSALYGAYAFIGNTFANDVIVSKSEILLRVGKLTSLPQGEPDAVVRVQDAETLKKQKDFFADVKVGDYVIMYPGMAIIYDLRNNSIVALKRTDR